MDRHSILKFFDNNAGSDDDKGLQVINHGHIVVNYGNITTHIGNCVDHNKKLTQADKDQVNALIRSLEEKNETNT
ncbi:hypothetical protein BMT54_01195 [Pasteurellaceae bacterium 15-036681]|nr:hypothetical protein BMT54_01195 [Pasteurellaceae bacterium 15-036681]